MCISRHIKMCLQICICGCGVRLLRYPIHTFIRICIYVHIYIFINTYVCFVRLDCLRLIIRLFLKCLAMPFAILPHYEQCWPTGLSKLPCRPNRPILQGGLAMLPDYRKSVRRHTLPESLRHCIRCHLLCYLRCYLIAG